MDKKPLKSYAGIVVMLGAVWGLSEAALGMWLKNCASSVSGSLMTGFALFFIAISWVVSRRAFGIVLLVLVASLFKLFDAFLPSLPVLHGAVANPIFAFVLEVAAFLICISLWKQSFLNKRSGQGLLGGTSALGAVGLFPLAIFLALFTIPLGFWLGERFEAVFLGEHRLPTLVSPLGFLFCLAIVALIRLI